MNFKDKIKDLKPHDLNCNVFDVYSYNGLSMQELLCQFFHKINDCIKISNDTIDLASWLVNEGLSMEVANKLDLWLEDGTLENIINVNLFNSINTEIDNLNTQLSQNTNNINVFYNDLKNDNIRTLKTFKPLKRDKYGFLSVDFIGDSITEGYDCSDFVNKSYFALVRYSLLKKHKSSNIGYVNLTNKGGYHSINRTGTWSQIQDYKALGNQSNTTSEVGASMSIWVNNPQKYFKICYSSGAGLGSFDVYNEVSGEKIGSIVCEGDNIYNNISNEFQFSEISSSRLIKIVCTSGTVRINGIWYYDDINKVMVNNYARSGMALGETSTTLIDDMTTGSYTFFALNHNDTYNSTFQNNLDRVCNNIISRRGGIFILDFRWGNTVENNNVKKALLNKYTEIKDNTYISAMYLDIGKAFNNNLDLMFNEGFFYDDYSHPYDTGMMMIADSICEKLNLKLELNLPLNDEWVEIGSVGAPSFQNNHTNYTGYKSKFRLKNGVVTVILCLDSAKQGSENFIFYIPSMYRPIVDTRICLDHRQGNGLTMHVGMDGKVYMISDITQNHRFINFSYSI